MAYTWLSCLWKWRPLEYFIHVHYISLEASHHRIMTKLQYKRQPKDTIYIYELDKYSNYTSVKLCDKYECKELDYHPIEWWLEFENYNHNATAMQIAKGKATKEWQKHHKTSLVLKLCSVEQ